MIETDQRSDVEGTTVEQRIKGISERVLDNYLDLFSVLMAEHGIDADLQQTRLKQTVRALLDIKISETIFDGGRRIATRLVPDVEPPSIEVNAELFKRVGNDEVLIALARPIAQILDLTPLSVALLFQTTDERMLRDLATRATRSLTVKAVQPVQLQAFVSYRAKKFSQLVSGVVDSWVEPPTPLQPLIINETFTSWPEWVDVVSKPFAESAVKWVQNALKGTQFADLSETIVALCWEALSLTPNSFIRHAGRELRARGAHDIAALLRTFAEVLARRQHLSLELSDWPNYLDLFKAYKQLVKRERQLFGAMWGADDASLDLLQPARDLFGLSEPEELPWNYPIVSWSLREANAARDLLNGLESMLPTASLNAFMRDASVEATLNTDSPVVPVGVRVVPTTAKIPNYDHVLTQTAYAAVQKYISNQFDRLEVEDQIEVVTHMRATLDDLFPQAKQVWERRFHNWNEDEVSVAFARLSVTFQTLTGMPIFYDPFGTPGSATLTKYPGLMLAVGVQPPPFEVSIGVPLSSVLATTKAGPLRVRVVAVNGKEATYLCDRPLHIAKISELPVEQVLAGVLGDNLNLALTAN